MSGLIELSDHLSYHLVRRLAEGGMGVVYEARQLGVDEFEKTVAIKLIREKFSQIPEFRKNFVGEARLVADLIHTNIVQTYHLGMARGRYFMVMEYVNGVSLDEFIYQHIAECRAIPVDMAAFIISRVCRGLAYAHTKTNRLGQPLGIVHRDITPRNIMLGLEGDVKLTDFGIAKARDLMYSKEGDVIAGKDEYLSPEQARREVTDARADLFPCGIILAEMLLSEHPFEHPDPAITRRNIVSQPLPDFRQRRTDLPDELAVILERMLARDRRERFASAGDLLTTLETYLYSGGYGLTNEKLGVYLRDLFAPGNAYRRDFPPSPLDEQTLPLTPRLTQ